MTARHVTTGTADAPPARLLYPIVAGERENSIYVDLITWDRKVGCGVSNWVATQYQQKRMYHNIFRMLL